MLRKLINLLITVLTLIRNVFAAIGGEAAGKKIDRLLFFVSGRHKIQRIALNLRGVDKMRSLERCLALSACPELQKFKTIIDTPTLTATIMRVKKIKPEHDAEFAARVSIIFNPVCQINKLLLSAGSERREVYDTENTAHEALLMELWETLQPENSLENRISEQWDVIGFQGTDPATDFRGMGVFGLKCLLHFAKKDVGKSGLVASQHPQYGFSLAITSINITSLMIQLLESGQLRSHFLYKCVKGGSRNLTLTDIYELHASLLHSFIKFYQDRKPACIMEFNTHKAAFGEDVKERMAGDRPVFDIVS